MSVFKQKDRRTYTYEFRYRGKPYKGSTGATTEAAALIVEQQARERIERVAGGQTDLRDAPAFATWAGVYYDHKATSMHKVKRPDQIDFLIRTMLKFWGRRPSDPAKVDPHAPYRDLTLADPIVRPELLDEFEEWMMAQGFSGSHRNHLRTQISGCYRVALLPKHRRLTGVTMNPMVGVPRDRRTRRKATLAVEQLHAWLAHASYHVRLAMAIAALAPKLRRSNVLALEWDVHVDRLLSKITVDDHKTDRAGDPLVVLVDPHLRAILADARKRNRGRWVVTYRGQRVKDVRGGVKLAAERAGIPYGVGRKDGVTFHTIRHAVATWFAEMADVTEPQRMALMGHTDLQTTQGYTHLHPAAEQQPLAQLAAQLDLTAVVTQPWRRWTKGQTPLTSLAKREELRLVRREEKREDPPAETREIPKKAIEK